MNTVEKDGRDVIINKLSLYKYLQREANWLEAGAGPVYVLQTNGVPDILGQFNIMVPRMQQALDHLVPQIEDEELRALFHALYLHAQTILVEINGQLISVLAKRVGLPVPRTKRQRKILEEKRYGLLYEKTPLIDENYRQVLQKAEEVVKEFRATKKRVDERLAKHLTELSEL